MHDFICRTREKKVVQKQNCTEYILLASWYRPDFNSVNLLSTYIFVELTTRSTLFSVYMIFCWEQSYTPVVEHEKMSCFYCNWDFFILFFTMDFFVISHIKSLSALLS